MSFTGQSRTATIAEKNRQESPVYKIVLKKLIHWTNPSLYGEKNSFQNLQILYKPHKIFYRNIRNCSSTIAQKTRRIKIKYHWLK